MTVSDAPNQPRTVSTAIFLLSLSAMYTVVIEIWSAPVLFIEVRGLLFVVGLVIGISGFYLLYGWLIFKTWQGVNGARYALVALILVGIAIHAILALTPMGELFGPASITAILDGLRIVAVILLLASPREYWGKIEGN